ncbi:MAG: cytochrome c oxidase assembly protein [Micromonosporaceae bacterium]
MITGCLLVAGTVLAVLLQVTGAVTEVLPGLGDPGPITPWALPLTTLAVRLAAVATVGLLVASAFLVPGLVTGDRRTDGRTVSAPGYRWLRAASWAALTWLVATGAQLLFTLSDVLGVPPQDTVTRAVVWAWQLELTRAMVLSMLGAAVIAVAARLVLSTTGTAWLAVLAVATTLPPAFTGHAAAAGNHQLAVDSMLWHVAGAAVWAGGLLALLLARRTAVDAARRYSRAAAWCFVIVAVSGLTNALGQIDLGDLASSAYGLMVLGKAAALVALGGFGLWHRRVSLRALDAGHPGAFRRFAVGELLLFAGTFGLAIALARTAAPVVEAPESSAQSLLGFRPPDGPPTGRAILLDWLPSPVFLGLAAVAVICYSAGFWRLRRAGTPWPVWQLASWCAGWAVVVVATSSGLAAYAPLMFSVHMAQHLVLMTLAPILMVLGAPVTLALRALRRTTEPGMRGPREWLRLALHSRVTKLLAHPVVALAVLTVSLFGMYFTSLYELALRYHVAHLAMLLHLLAAGYLFYWAVVGVDPTPHRVAPPVRMLVLFAGMAFHAFFGVALMQSGFPMAAGWYAELDLPWLGDPLADQRTAGGIAWSFGEIPSLVVAIALVAQWLRADEREARRFDRAVERAAVTGDASQDPHVAYNAYLKRLAEADRRRTAAQAGQEQAEAGSGAAPGAKTD